MDFSNKPNWQATDQDVKDGRWISRSCTVLAIPFFHTSDGDTYVPLGQRSDKMPDYQGYWGLPCGYLDWDEPLLDCVRREVFEELGLELEVTDVSPQPDFVMSHPLGDSRQNVTFRFIIHKFVAPDEALPLLKPGPEVSQASWVDVLSLNQRILAFNHSDVIRWALRQAR